MADSIRQQILVNIETALEAIQTKNGFRLDVRKVERVLRHWDEVQSSERPWIGYMPQTSSVIVQPGRTFRVTMPVLIMAYVQGDLQVRDRNVNNMLDDLVVAMTQDQTLAGCATSVTLSSHDTDEGDDDAGGVVQCLFEIVYFRTTAKS